MRIATNIQSIKAIHGLERVHEALKIRDMKLSSGTRIIQASYDPAGLAISEKIRSKIRGIGQLERNINDGISLIQVAEGTLSTINDIGTRLKELAMQSATDTVGDSERHMADLEFQSLKTEISRLAKSSRFNGNHILNDTGSTYQLQIGLYNTPKSDQIIYNMNKALGPVNNLQSTPINIRTKSEALATFNQLDKLLHNVSMNRADLGSINKRLESIMNNTLISKESNHKTNSIIRDTDIAKETGEKAIIKIREKAATALLIQANNKPSHILKLLE